MKSDEEKGEFVRAAPHLSLKSCDGGRVKGDEQKGEFHCSGSSLVTRHLSLRCWLGFGALLIAAAAPLGSDTIYQTTAQGKQEVVQRDAIVVKADSSLLVYKHFDLRERRVTKVTVFKSSLPHTVQTSSPADQKQIVEIWKRFGYKAAVTDQAGKTSQLFDVYLDFYPPGGRGSLLESVAARTSFPVLLDGGGADEIEFSKIDRIEIAADQLKFYLRSGQTLTGKFLMPTDKPAEVRVLGITDDYPPASGDVFDFSIPLQRLKEIRFD